MWAEVKAREPSTKTKRGVDSDATGGTGGIGFVADQGKKRKELLGFGGKLEKLFIVSDL